MSFTWPLALLSLLAVPALVGGYLLQRRRKRRVAVRYSSVALIRAAMPTRSPWRRLLPMALFLAGIAGLGVASARPQASMKVPLGRTSIILALDVSRSMCATDVEPNRMTVAQDAARTFVKSQPSGTRIGIVAFAGFAELVVPPTTKKRDLIAAIDGLTTARGTVIGAAELKALDAIAAINPDVAPVGADVGTGGTAGVDGAPDGSPAPTTGAPFTPGAKGYIPDIVVLLTDGANTRGIDPVEAAQQAVDRRVRIYTIGFGTMTPTQMVCTAAQLGSDAFDDGGFGGAGGGGAFPPPVAGGGFGGASQYLVIDEPTLQEVAKMTGGAYYRAQDANQLKGVFAKLPKQVVLQSRKVEISAAFAAFGALLVGAGAVLSLRWNRTL